MIFNIVATIIFQTRMFTLTWRLQ